jgi:hypothetical protein
MRVVAGEKAEVLHIYVTKEEKELLKKKAKESDGLSLSSYVKQKALAEDNVVALSFAGMFPNDAILDSNVERNHVVKTLLSEEEFQHVKKIAGATTISSFLRKLLLNANSGKFTFEVKVDDLNELRTAFSEFNARIEGIIGALRYRSELYHSDIALMRSLLEEININVKKCMSKTMTDRKYIRKKGIDYLHEQIDKILSIKKNNEKEEKK